MTSTRQPTSGVVPTVRRIVISTRRLEKALVFYRDVLGLAGANVASGPATLMTGSGVEVMLHERDTTPSDAAVAPSFVIERLDAIVKRWDDLGGEVIDAPRTQPWGERMAVVRDADGHIVCLIDANADQPVTMSEPAEPDPGDTITRLVDAVVAVSGAFLAEGDALVAEFELTAARWLVLGAVQDRPRTAAEIARLRGLRRQSVRETVARLERDGLLASQPNDADRRASLLVPTAKGRRALARIEPKRARWASELENILDADDLDAAVGLLTRLRAQLDSRRG